MADDANDGDASEEEERAPTANNAAFHLLFTDAFIERRTQLLENANEDINLGVGRESDDSETDEESVQGTSDPNNDPNDVDAEGESDDDPPPPVEPPFQRPFFGRKGPVIPQLGGKGPVIPQLGGKSPAHLQLGGKSLARIQGVRRKRGVKEKYKPIPLAKPHPFPKGSTRRRKQGTLALREIRNFQGTQGDQALIAWAPWVRLVKEVAQDVCDELRLPSTVRFQPAALDALRSAAEDMIVCQYTAGMHVAVGAGRTTLLNKDLHVAWHVGYELRHDMNMIVEWAGDWMAASKNGRRRRV